MSWLSKVLGVSVVMACAAMTHARSSPWRANSSPADDGRGGAAGGRAALEARQRVEHRGRGHHLVQRQGLAEHGQRVARRVLARLDRDAAEGARAMPYCA
jgi:hypothetical protein